MNTKSIELLEFSKIKIMLADLTNSNLGRRLVESLAPKTNLSAVKEMLQETTEARYILDVAGTPPMYGLSDINQLLDNVKIGAVLEPSALENITDFLRGCRKTRQFMQKYLNTSPRVAGYCLGITPYPEIEEAILRSIVNGIVVDDASPGLRKVRREIGRLKDKIRAKLEQIISSEAKAWLQETVVCIKDSRQVLMVKAGNKDKIPGIIHGSSGSGNTLFIEPMGVHQLNNELRILEGVEQEEVYQILATLSSEVLDRVNEIEHNLEIMAQYDLAFAKARLSRMMNGIEPLLNEEDRIVLNKASHPLLTNPVPLNFYIGHEYRSLIITGPNTGGKTVAIKTIGLLTVMMQAGLHVPAAEGTEMAIFQNILVDIGDGQDITQSLSTFSSHITNIIKILEDCREQTLVLIDEVGTGTDPLEGSALAIAILEYLHRSGAITIASTHYPELKQYALRTTGFKNGCMAFDRVNLKPLYRLIIGKPGESNALWIAEKLGLPGEVLKRAKEQLDSEDYKMVPIVEFEASIEEQVMDETIFEKVPDKKTFGPAPNQQSFAEPEERKIKIGDMVTIPYLNEKGVVCTMPDSKGRIRVLVKGKKMEIQLSRVKLQIPAEQLYPENYDLNIVFLSKEERRLKHKMSKHHQPGQERVVPVDEQ